MSPKQLQLSVKFYQLHYQVTLSYQNLDETTQPTMIMTTIMTPNYILPYLIVMLPVNVAYHLISWLLCYCGSLYRLAFTIILAGG